MTASTTNPEAAFRLAEPDVIHQMFGQEVVAIDLRTGSYYSLSDVAGQVWLQLGGSGALVEDVAQALATRYGLPDAQALADLTPFLDELLRLELIVPCAAAERSAPVDALAPAEAAYAPPTLSTYNDLADLFLLDPVHEVDAATGWPHQAPEAEATLPSTLHTAALNRDILRATLEGTTLLVNRDRGCYAVLDHGGTVLWDALEAGAVPLTDPALRDAMEAAGLVMPAPAAATAQPMAGPAGITVHRELEALMRPWIRTARPARREPTDQGRQLLDRLDRCFEETAADGPGIEHRGFRIGGASVRIVSIPGQDGQRVQAALAHLEAVLPTDQPADLEIRLWNLSAPPRAPLLADLLQRLRDNWEAVCGPRGEVLELQGTTVSAIYNAGPDVLSVVDLPRGRAWFVKLDDQPMPYWEIGSPFRFLLHRWFASRGSQYIHAAAVGDARGAVLLVGAGGSGKSTTSMLCAAAGMQFAGDDYCLADPATGWVHSLYGTGKLLGEEDLERFPALRGRATNPDGFERGGDGKAVVMLTDVWPDRMVSGLPIRAVAIPRITGCPETTVAPATAAEALVALLPSTVGQLPEADGGDCDRLVALLRPLPTHTIHLGTDPAGITRAVASLLG